MEFQTIQTEQEASIPIGKYCNDQTNKCEKLFKTADYPQSICCLFNDLLRVRTKDGVGLAVKCSSCSEAIQKSECALNRATAGDPLTLKVVAGIKAKLVHLTGISSTRHAYESALQDIADGMTLANLKKQTEAYLEDSYDDVQQADSVIAHKHLLRIIARGG